MREAPTYEDIHSKQVMNRVSAERMPFDWSLNPYRGCTHGCSFCYARNTHTYMGLSADDAFRQQVFIKADAPELLEEQLARKLRKHRGNRAALAKEIGLLAIGTATDPYQSVEATRQITKQCLEVLVEYEVPTTITTRSPLILRDIDLLKRLNLHSVHISIHTLDKGIWRSLEPATPSPVRRLETVKQLKAEGLPVDIFLAPIVPFLTDGTDALRTVIQAGAEYGADAIWPSVLRLNAEVRAWFFGVLKERYPILIPSYERLYHTAYPANSYVQPLMTRVNSILQEQGFSTAQHRRERYASDKRMQAHSIGMVKEQGIDKEPFGPSSERSEQLRLPI